ncbi:MAG: hypothetical protein R3E53_22495 [Myxococcota bacterium]
MSYATLQPKITTVATRSAAKVRQIGSSIGAKAIVAQPAANAIT